MIGITTAFLLGALGWTAVEYLLHRFVGHGTRRPVPSSVWARLTPRGFLGAFNDEHLHHHADARYFAPTSQKVVAALATMLVLGAVGSVLVGPGRGLVFALGFSLTYAAYEILHRRIHTHPPRGRYGRWMRRHHLFHHFKTPRLNHGVTSPLWDKVARTERRLDDGQPLRVPRHLAPPWMTDGGGAVWPTLARDYVVASAGAVAARVAMTEGRAKALVVGVDGVRGDAMGVVASRADSHVGALARRGAWSFDALSTVPAVSGPAWGSVLTGVWTEKHGIVDNTFRSHRLSHYPPFLQRMPERRRASIVNWAPINDHLHGGAGTEIVEAHRSDARVAARAADLLAGDRALDVVFVHFDEVDACGHRTGYGRRNPLYRRAIVRADRRIGALLAALRARPTFAREDWLVVVVADHGGQWFGHGRDNAANRRVPLVVAGAGWPSRPLGTEAAVVDVAATVLHHMGVALRPEWRLDGAVHAAADR